MARVVLLAVGVIAAISRVVEAWNVGPKLFDRRVLRFLAGAAG